MRAARELITTVPIVLVWACAWVADHWPTLIPWMATVCVMIVAVELGALWLLAKWVRKPE